MTKKEIVKQISTDLDITRVVAGKAVQRVLDSITESLVTEGRIELRGFGVFQLVKRKAREARNPRTGEKVLVNERWTVKFSPGKQMQDTVTEAKDWQTEPQAEEPVTVAVTD